MFNSYIKGVNRDRRHRDHVDMEESGNSRLSRSTPLVYQLTIARFGDSWDKIGIGITPDPFGRGAYNLQSISATRKKVVWFTRLGSHWGYPLSVFVARAGFSVKHALNCPTGGYATLRYNELRDFTAEVLSDVCAD